MCVNYVIKCHRTEDLKNIYIIKTEGRNLLCTPSIIRRAESSWCSVPTSIHNLAWQPKQFNQGAIIRQINNKNTPELQYHPVVAMRIKTVYKGVHVNTKHISNLWHTIHHLHRWISMLMAKWYKSYKTAEATISYLIGIFSSLSKTLIASVYPQLLTDAF